MPAVSLGNPFTSDRDIQEAILKTETYLDSLLSTPTVQPIQKVN